MHLFAYVVDQVEVAKRTCILDSVTLLRLILFANFWSILSLDFTVYSHKLCKMDKMIPLYYLLFDTLFVTGLSLIHISEPTRPY